MVSDRIAALCKGKGCRCGISTWARAAAMRYEPPLPPVLFVLLVSVSHWWFGTDEGINLMKGALVANGFSLYSDIWSDQPPVLTFFLAGLEWVFPHSVTAARAVMLGFSGLLLWSLFRIVFRLEGRAIAWLAVAALAAIASFQALSVKVMVGLPAVALAVAALDQVLLGASDRKEWRYWLAGALFAVSLQTKLFTLTLLPVLILAALLRLDGDSRLSFGIRPGSNLGRLLLGTTVVFLVIAAIADEPILSQLVMPHHVVSGAYDASRFDILFHVAKELITRLPILVSILLALGLLAAFGRMSATRLVPLIWLVSAGLVVSLHRPYFSHQLILIYPAIAWVAALSMELIRDKTIRTAISFACILLLAASALLEPMRNGRRNPASAQVMPLGSPKRRPTRGCLPTTRWMPIARSALYPRSSLSGPRSE
jgi:4-amino-4-deoxy-L-arabinose transferase-like glycosyltransferase